MRCGMRVVTRLPGVRRLSRWRPPGGRGGRGHSGSGRPPPGRWCRAWSCCAPPAGVRRASCRNGRTRAAHTAAATASRWYGLGTGYRPGPVGTWECPSSRARGPGFRGIGGRAFARSSSFRRAETSRHTIRRWQTGIRAPGARPMYRRPACRPAHSVPARWRNLSRRPSSTPGARGARRGSTAL